MTARTRSVIISVAVCVCDACEMEWVRGESIMVDVARYEHVFQNCVTLAHEVEVCSTCRLHNSERANTYFVLVSHRT